MTLVRSIKTAHKKLEKSTNRQDKFLTDALKLASDTLEPLVAKLDDAIVRDTAARELELPQGGSLTPSAECCRSLIGDM